MSRDDLHTKRWSPSRVDLPVLPRESPSGKIQTRYFPPRREILWETNNSCSCSCSNSCSNLSHSWCMGEQLSYIHCWGVPQGSRSRPPASTGTLRYTPPVNVGNCTYSMRLQHMIRCPSSGIRGYSVFVLITRLGLGFGKIWFRSSPKLFVDLSLFFSVSRRNALIDFIRIL